MKGDRALFWLCVAAGVFVGCLGDIPGVVLFGALAVAHFKAAFK